MTVYINGVSGGSAVTIPIDELQSKIVTVANITARDALTVGTGSGEIWVGDVVVVTDNGNGKKEAFKHNGSGYISLAQPEETSAYVTSATYTITNEVIVIVDASSNSVAVTLPDASTLAGYSKVTILRVDTTPGNTLTIDDDGGNNINSSTSFTMLAGESFDFFLDATNNKWWAK